MLLLHFLHQAPSPLHCAGSLLLEQNLRHQCAQTDSYSNTKRITRLCQMNFHTFKWLITSFHPCKSFICPIIVNSISLCLLIPHMWWMQQQSIATSILLDGEDSISAFFIELSWQIKLMASVLFMLATTQCNHLISSTPTSLMAEFQFKMYWCRVVPPCILCP